MHDAGLLAVLQAERVVLVVLVLELLPRRGQFRDPRGALPLRQRVGQRLERRLFVRDDAEIERPVAAEIFGDRMNADRLHVGIEAVLADVRHQVLADEDRRGRRCRARRPRGSPTAGARRRNGRATGPDSTTAISFFSASRFSASHPLWKNTPWPATIIGRSAFWIMSTAVAMSFGDGCATHSVR